MTEWRKILGEDERFELSDEGHVRTLDYTTAYVHKIHGESVRHIKGRDLVPYMDRGVTLVKLSNRNGGRRIAVLVAKTFHGLPDDDYNPREWTVINIDGDVWNNSVDNVEWVRRIDLPNRENRLRWEEFRTTVTADYVSQLFAA